MQQRSSSNAFLTTVIIIVTLVGLVAFLALSSVSATLAWMSGGGGGGPCQPPPMPGTSTAVGVGTPVASPSATTPAGSCVPPSGSGALVVQWATAMADALYVDPACGGQISYPNCYYTWYKAPGTTYPPGAPTFPEAVIRYGEQVCPGCSAWANGTYQCVSFVRGAYSQVYPMTLTANAFDLWALYTGQPGWMEVPSAAAPPGQRGIPHPGDVMVFKDTGVGHVAIVMRMQLPTATTNGAVMFSNANSLSPYTTMPLLPDLTVDTSSWPGYTVWGYIRPGAELYPHFGKPAWWAVYYRSAPATDIPAVPAYFGGIPIMNLKTLLALPWLLNPLPVVTWMRATWTALLVLGSISGFFTNLYNDLTAFALAMATFFFAWAALLYMTANQNENHRVSARGALYVALGGLALAILAQTVASLVNNAALGQ